MDTNKSPAKQWTGLRALTLMAVCLLAGISGGWAIRGTRRPAKTETAKAADIPAAAATSANPVPQAPSPDQLKTMADNQAASLIAKLNADPKNLDLLTSIGNLYYDAQQYPVAVNYYGRVLAVRPSDAAVRTDMATAYWYLGNADKAIAEFNTALKSAPTNPNTLFNLGLVKWEGKHDSAAAIADWKKLLATNPEYAARDQVKKMLSDVETQAAKPGAKG
ncbi:MAG TPA: tetratricopeptide repeat protein [Terracidiphilus sp.]|nr:tetratricopeptide repeat protein [Terracidiphilus sp.]